MPVGGGGLISGVATAVAKSHRGQLSRDDWSGGRGILRVQTSLRAGRLVEIVPGATSRMDSAAIQTGDGHVRPDSAARHDEIVTVSEDGSREPSSPWRTPSISSSKAPAPLASPRSWLAAFRARRRVAILVTGSNIDLPKFAALLGRVETLSEPPKA